MSVVGSNIGVVDATVAFGVLKRHKAFGVFPMPVVEPNMWVVIDRTKKYSHVGI